MPEQRRGTEDETKKGRAQRSAGRSGVVMKCLVLLPIIAVALPILGTVFAGVAIGTSYWVVGSVTIIDHSNGTSEDPPKQLRYLSHTGLFKHCELLQDSDSSEEASSWNCINVIELMGARELEGDILTEQLKSVIAFEIISFVASCSAGVSSIVGWLTGHPLAMLVSGVVGAMAGLFMMVGNSMYMIVHNEVQKRSGELQLGYDEVWYFGWSLNLGWCAFVMCTLATLVQFIVYTAFQKYRKEHPEANMSSLCQYFNKFDCRCNFTKSRRNTSSNNLPISISNSKEDISLKASNSPQPDA